MNGPRLFHQSAAAPSANSVSREAGLQLVPDRQHRHSGVMVVAVEQHIPRGTERNEQLPVLRLQLLCWPAGVRVVAQQPGLVVHEPHGAPDGGPVFLRQKGIKPPEARQSIRSPDYRWHSGISTSSPAAVRASQSRTSSFVRWSPVR